MKVIVKVKAKRVFRHKESDGKINPLVMDDKEKLWIETESGRIIVLPLEDIEGLV
ncbi:MAG: hypothetical protein H0Z19_11810 [Archaeoglobus sp.]|uniref:hypothetical protein n=1 Tax=Archaeoglobus sp. TaxID=1872626 RepID=UPI001D2B0FBB|nr:hypothetical protein [Archaeoglobus sp.]MBO8181134.1 hypothetical protein [Archaeoglobus sp.]